MRSDDKGRDGEPGERTNEANHYLNWFDFNRLAKIFKFVTTISSTIIFDENTVTLEMENRLDRVDKHSTNNVQSCAFVQAFERLQLEGRQSCEKEK